MRWPWGSRRQIAWSMALVLLRMAVFGTILFGVTRPLLTEGLPPRIGANPQLLEDAILAALAAGFAWVLIGRVPGASWEDLGLARKGLARNVALGVATFAFGLLIILVRARIEGVMPIEAWQAVTGYSARQRVQMLLVAVHVVFGEELIFRGYMQPGLRARYSAPVAIGITSLIFALYHVDFSLHGFLGHVLWGVVWGLARERSGSTVPPSVAHFLNWAVLGWF